MVAIFLLAGLGTVTNSFALETVKVGSAAAKNAMSSCKGTGSVTFPKTKSSPTFGCMNADGSGIVCGGEKASDKKTCDIFRQTPPRLPTRDEIRYAEMAAKESQQPAAE